MITNKIVMQHNKKKLKVRFLFSPFPTISHAPSFQSPLLISRRQTERKRQEKEERIKERMKEK